MQTAGTRLGSGGPGSPFPYTVVKVLLEQSRSRVLLGIKNLPANAGDLRDSGSISGSGRSAGEGNGNPLQFSHLENPMDRGASRATDHGVQRVGQD